MNTLAEIYERHCVKGHDPESTKRRLFSKIFPSSVLGCWEWLGAKDKRGRALVYKMGKRHHAARVMWEVLNGDPGALCVLHRCDNVKCVNPFHLFLGDQQDNVRDMVAKGRQRGAVGMKNPRAKLTEGSVAEIKRYYASFHRSGEKKPNLKPLIEKYRISDTVLWLIEHERIWKHVKIDT